MLETQEYTLIILRGLPGSGKSTLAKILSEKGKHPSFSIDDYFTNSFTGEYAFDYQKNYLAYKQCETNTEKSMKAGASKIIIHNTFTLDWELEPYFNLASKYKYTLCVVTVENYHRNKNVHGISEEQLEKMASKYKVKLY